MNKKELSLKRKFLREQNKLCSKVLVQVPPINWPSFPDRSRVEVWRSQSYLVQVFDKENGAWRVSVNRTELDSNGHYKDGLTWEELMEIKRQIGHGHSWAVEILPADSQIVNVANMRHFWLLDVAPSFAWRGKA
jgi:hypothetical protein